MNLGNERYYGLSHRHIIRSNLWKNGTAGPRLFSKQIVENVIDGIKLFLVFENPTTISEYTVGIICLYTTSN